MYPKIGHSYSVINVYKAVNTQLSLRSILGAILDSVFCSVEGWFCQDCYNPDMLTKGHFPPTPVDPEDRE